MVRNGTLLVKLKLKFISFSQIKHRKKRKALAHTISIISNIIIKILAFD